MASIEVVSAGGSGEGSVDLDPNVFEAPVKPHLLHAEVRRQLSRRRAGTHATKNRSAVSGGGAKPYRQKGTGRARQGTTRAPQFAGGGSVFGPTPRSYEHGLTKKTRRAALRCALSLRQQEGALTIAEGVAVEDYKTRQVVALLEQLGIGSASVLIVIPEADPVLETAARNLRQVSVIRVPGLNVHDVLRHEKLLVARDALAGIVARLGNTEEATA